MFRGPNIIDEKYSISEYIEGDDIFNSELLRRIHELPAESTFIINNNQYRIDLLSRSIYGSDKYSQILLFYNGLSINGLTIGTKLNYPSKSDTDNLVRELNKR